MAEASVGCHKFPLLIRPAMGDRSDHPRKQSFRIPDRTEIAPESAHCYDSYIGEVRSISAIVAQSVNRIILAQHMVNDELNSHARLKISILLETEVSFKAKCNSCSSCSDAVAFADYGRFSGSVTDRLFV
ncbi:hypothetical protein [Mesorhizobium sp.]|uniref:hypothetical protein n=1 Tax=Mesorhizobium sp. TaxID=1871066 RepID=UPI0025DF0AE9|nr:hypothetical protein [Mesorhizobium sp.]